MSENTPIRFGAVIHLQNSTPDGGYLDVRGRVDDKPVTGRWYDPHITSLVSTHEGPHRFMGSGSWQILSADGKPIGETVQVGDTVRLRNMNSEGGYLDTFEWVNRLQPPFNAYPMTIGVFASNKHRGGSGNSGVWRILTADGKKDGSTLVAGDEILLENRDMHPVYLCTHGRVADHPAFQDYEGQQRFVFTHRPEPSSPFDDNYQWRVSLLSEQPENRYYLWHEDGERRIDLGVLAISGLRSHALIALKADSIHEGRKLIGKVAYEGERHVDFEAKWVEGTQYDVVHLLNENIAARYPNGRWMLAGRSDKRITKIDLVSPDDGRSLQGAITYGEEPPLTVVGLRASALLFDQRQKAALHDFFALSLWQSRIQGIDDALRTAVIELDDVLTTIAGAGDNNLSAWLNDDADKLSELPTHLRQKLEQLAKQAAPTAEPAASAALDVDYQVQQLLNIYTLWHTMDQFWEQLSDTAEKSIHRLNDARILPPVSRIRECFREFTLDFEIVQSAIQQRRWLPTTAAAAFKNAQAGTLVITDKLVAMAMAPYQRLLADTQITPITYFSKKIHIRRVPYTERFVLVGLTYDLTAAVRHALQDGAFDPQEKAVAAFELMAIPHEVGHFVYHYAQIEADGADTFAEMSARFVDTACFRWCEEIFADLYGCVVSGPLTVLGLQALLATGDPDRALLDDEVHPTPALRPYFLTEMLHLLNEMAPDRYAFAETAAILDANWTAVLERWGFMPENIRHGRPTRLRVPGRPSNHVEAVLNIDTAVQNARPIMQAFAKMLLDRAEFTPWPTNDFAVQISADIPWCAGQSAIDEYVKQMKWLAGPGVARKQLPQPYLTTDAHLPDGVKRAITAVLDESNEKIGATLFADIIDGWKDSGPHGWGGH